MFKYKLPHATLYGIMLPKRYFFAVLMIWDRTPPGGRRVAFGLPGIVDAIRPDFTL